MRIMSIARPIAVGLAMASLTAGAQAADVVVDPAGVVPYVIDARNVVARSGFDLCWRTGYWTPALAETAMAGQFPVGCACDKDIVAADKCTVPAPAPAPAAEAPKPITLSAKALFAFDKAVLTPAGKAEIDREVIAKLPQAGQIKMITIEGHTDRLGSQTYNQALSERRANAVRDYLVQRGVSPDLMDVIGYGKTQPVPGVSCADSLGRSKLIQCLEPHRRVVVRISAAPK